MFKFLKDDSPEKEDGPILKETRPAYEIQVQDLHYQLAEKVPFGEQSFDTLKLNYILVAQLLRSDFVKGDQRIKGILDSTSDLIPGVYEGGFKIWECTLDLVKFLERNSDLIKINETTEVLDLGCGSGVLGLYALGKGALVDFQDYNSEVIDYLTVPNVIVNFKDSGLLRSRFYSGDWEALRVLWTGGENKGTNKGRKYDLILSSETIYNLDNLSKFVNIVKDCLKPEGCLLLAAKTCYFGVGGGTQSFLNVVAKDSCMTSEVVQVIRQGVQREIIKVTLKSV